MSNLIEKIDDAIARLAQLIPNPYKYLNIHKFFTQQDIDDWQIYEGDGEHKLEQGALKIGDNSDNDKLWLIHKTLYPLQDNTVYCIKVRFKKPVGDYRTYVGVAGLAEDKTSFINNRGENYYGSQHYGWWSNDTYDDYEEITCFVCKRGTDVAHYRGIIMLPENVHYFRPLFIANYSGSGITYLESYQVEIIQN